MLQGEVSSHSPPSQVPLDGLSSGAQSKRVPSATLRAAFVNLVSTVEVPIDGLSVIRESMSSGQEAAGGPTSPAASHITSAKSAASSGRVILKKGSSPKTSKAASIIASSQAKAANKSMSALKASAAAGKTGKSNTTAGTRTRYPWVELKSTESF